ncbi:hypothetical protein L1987_80174 [Smallanthus sonchifolius]|uniref:Uncharacterized protein n=1 Tax=Smallanthus sonchifolius TaxID=185202 RepID=A0ACB8YM05_9ASTR|nr:hypothetical protein L1987_80174 [Smallanthus sonchifolius]
MLRSDVGQKHVVHFQSCSNSNVSYSNRLIFLWLLNPHNHKNFRRCFNFFNRSSSDKLKTQKIPLNSSSRSVNHGNQRESRGQ